MRDGCHVPPIFVGLISGSVVIIPVYSVLCVGGMTMKLSFSFPGLRSHGVRNRTRLIIWMEALKIRVRSDCLQLHFGCWRVDLTKKKDTPKGYSDERSGYKKNHPEKFVQSS